MTNENPASDPPARVSFAPWVAGCLGAILALLAVGIFLAWQSRSPWGEVTTEGLAAAHQRWQEKKEPSYRMKLHLVGPQASEMEIVVRDGEPIEVVRDRLAIRLSRTWSSWTVDGLLQMIRIDLDSVATEGKQSLYLNGEFDPALGIPRHYRRVKFNPPLETGWDVVEWTTEPKE